MMSLLFATMIATAQPIDRTYEGQWYVSDSTDNNTGEREVYAFQTYIDRTDYMSLRLICYEGQPIFFVEWDKIAFPSQTVLTIGPVATPDSEPDEKSYVFRKSNEDSILRGLQASPEVSQSIISAIGDAKYLTVTAHLSSGSRTVGIEVDGTQRAWSRVSRHCPIQILPQPPI
jgi:hypothetical protein